MENKIVVYSPEDGYISDTDYELHISTDVKSKGGNCLQNEKIIMLYMLDEYYVYW